MFQVHFRTLFEGEKNSFADLNREISEAETILSDQAEQIDDRRNVSPTLDVILNSGFGVGFEIEGREPKNLKGDPLDNLYLIKSEII